MRKMNMHLTEEAALVLAHRERLIDVTIIPVNDAMVINDRNSSCAALGTG